MYMAGTVTAMPATSSSPRRVEVGPDCRVFHDSYSRYYQKSIPKEGFSTAPSDKVVSRRIRLSVSSPRDASHWTSCLHTVLSGVSLCLEVSCLN